MQYARLTKKAFLDLKHGRGDVKTNVSKIIYYMAVQNLIFTALQSALGSLIGDDDDEDKETHKRIANSMIDNVLGGLGFGGNAVMTIKNTILEYLKQEEKGWNADHIYTILKFFSLSPTIGSKGRKLYSAIQTEKFNKDVIAEMSMLDIDNPRYSSIANVISATTNIPLDRLVKKVDNVDAALTENITALERMALLMGWNTWDLDIDDSDILEIEERIKEKKEEKKKEKKKIKKKEEKEKTQEENKEKEEDNRKKKDGQCVAISRSGNRCKNKAISGGYCTIHAKVEQGTVERQCSQIKSNGERCKMKTKAKSGKCYYHD
jgi:glutamyl/glutaminyl-tRNA synthetase